MRRPRVLETHGYRMSRYERAMERARADGRNLRAMTHPLTTGARRPLDPAVKAARRARAKAARAARKRGRAS